MLSWLSRFVTKYARSVIAIWGISAVLILVLSLTDLGGQSLFARFSTQAELVSGSESAQGQEILDTLQGDGVNVSLMVKNVDISTKEQRSAVIKALAPAHQDLKELAGEYNVVDPFILPGIFDDPAAQALTAKNLDGFIILVNVDPNGDEIAASNDTAEQKKLAEVRTQVEQRLAQVPKELHQVAPEASGIVADDSLSSQALNNQVRSDLLRGELISLPLALLIMVLVFGGFLAAGTPIIGALVSVAGALGITYALAHVTTLQSFVVNIITIIGLGLSIDYGLLITSRYREELYRGQHDTGGNAVANGVRSGRRRSRRNSYLVICIDKTLNSAGRTVIFSAVTIAISLLSLFTMRPALLRSIGIASVSVVLVAMAAALTLIPALLILGGDRLQKPSVLRRFKGIGVLQEHLGDVTRDEGVFSALAQRVHQKPWAVFLLCTFGLIVMALPLHNLHMLSSGKELLPSDSPQYTYAQDLAQEYSVGTDSDAVMILAGTGQKVSTFLSKEVASTAGVTEITATAQAGDYTVAYLDLDGSAGSKNAETGVRNIRNLSAPVTTWVIGQAAQQVDFDGAIASGLPWALLVIIIATFGLLFVMTGSVLVPIKALLINSLSLAAALGTATWIFQGGHGSRLFGFTSIGGMENYVVVVAAAFGFGLAMDYEVFLLARIKENRNGGEDNDLAVEHGLQRSGRIITSAALIMVTVFLGFVCGKLLVIKETGLTLAIIVALDATVVRLLLVPATMKLLGEWNWWAPESLKNLYQRFNPTD